MAILIIEIPETAVKEIIDIVEQLGGRVISIDSGKKKDEAAKK